MEVLYKKEDFYREDGWPTELFRYFSYVCSIQRKRCNSALTMTSLH